jgi:hypothetical protein
MLNLPAAFAELAGMASAAFGAPYYAGVVIIAATPGGYDDGGNFIPGSPPDELACKVQIDAIDERSRPEGWTDKDYRFMILSSGFTGAIDADARIRVTDVTAPADFRVEWHVSALQRDPAGIGWVGKGRRA